MVWPAGSEPSPAPRRVSPAGGGIKPSGSGARKVPAQTVSVLPPCSVIAVCNVAPHSAGVWRLGQVTSQTWEEPSWRQIVLAGHCLESVQASQVWAVPQIGVSDVLEQSASEQHAPQPPAQQRAPGQSAFAQHPTQLPVQQTLSPGHGEPSLAVG